MLPSLQVSIMEISSGNLFSRVSIRNFSAFYFSLSISLSIFINWFSPSSFGFNYCWLSWAEFVLFPTLFSQPTCIRYLYRCFPVLLMSHFPAFLCCSVGCSVSQFCCLTFNRSWISTTLLWTFLNWFTSFSILLMRSAIPFWALSHPAYFFGENLQALTAWLWSRPHSFVLKLFGSHSILKVNTSVMSWLLYS